MDRPTRVCDPVRSFDVLGITESAFGVDTQRSITAWNTAAEKLLGIRAEVAVGKQCCALLRASHIACCAYCPHHRQGGASEPEAATSEQAAYRVPPSPLAERHQDITLVAFTVRSTTGDIRIVHLLRKEPARQVASAPWGTPGTWNGAAPPLDADPAHAVASGLTMPNESYASRPAWAPHAQITAREHEVLALLACGRSTREIAATLTISQVTARQHIALIMAKLGANTRIEAVVCATQQGLL